ncbi:hypothetical protein AB0C59_27550 [Streptomyces sp. NPDC048664]|uniref:hypothetical protein n=1 Tax=Streptomyces sp. NPDC048664 TaxID=3154505 RepID=UPI003432DB4A
MGPRIFYLELSIGDELGHDTAPDCCVNEMTAKDADDDGYREFVCGCCGTVVEIDDLGLVYDIRA